MSCQAEEDPGKDFCLRTSTNSQLVCASGVSIPSKVEVVIDKTTNRGGPYFVIFFKHTNQCLVAILGLLC